MSLSFIEYFNAYIQIFMFCVYKKQKSKQNYAFTAERSAIL